MNHTRGEEGVEGTDFRHGNDFEELFENRNNEAGIRSCKKGIAIISSGKLETLSTVLIRFSSTIFNQLTEVRQAYMRILRLNFVVSIQKSHDSPLAKQLVYACNVLDTWFHGHNTSR